MEKKINIAELLKNCPKGMELYSPIFGKVYLDKIRPHLAIVVTTDKEQGDFKEEFLYDGRYGMNGECMLFPSKGKTTWEGFIPPCQFKDGDILATDLGSVFYLNTRLNTDECYGCYVGIGGDGSFHICEPFAYYKPFAYKECCGLATEEEKQKLFDAIKANGHKWNAETKTLEKLIEPKFKVGDTITNGKFSIKIGYIDNEYYYEISRNIANRLFIKNQDEWELISDKFPNKFDIKTLKPFDKVLVRTKTFTPVWTIDFYDGYRPNTGGSFTPFAVTGGKYFQQCIPYENNKHLLGTTNDCDEYYKTWEQ